jgi:hypothetical protein
LLIALSLSLSLSRSPWTFFFSCLPVGLHAQLSASGITMDPSITTLPQLIGAVHPLRDSNHLLREELEHKCERLQADGEEKQASVAEMEASTNELRTKIAELDKQVSVGIMGQGKKPMEIRHPFCLASPH